MKKFNLLRFGLLLVVFASTMLAQNGYIRKELNVPKVDPAAMNIDGQMDESAWQNAVTANIYTATGSEMFTNKYYREDYLEPDYDEIFARFLWSKDTLYVFIQIDEMVNDSTDLYWNGKWTGDQLFVSISNRLGLDLDGSGRYNGNVFTVPDGPYYFVILGDTLTLNGGESSFIPEEYRRMPGDTTYTEAVFEPNFARMASVINKTDGVWTIEMAIFNPAVTAQSKLGFNVGGSTGSAASDEEFGDAYAYWTWQPNVPDDPYAEPAILDVWRDQELWADPGTSNLATSQAHAVLHFIGEDEIFIRKVVSVPEIDPSVITLDGQMNESVWQSAASANIYTSTGSEMFTNKYYREDYLEPDYDEIYTRFLWSKDTLFLFIHIDEMVNDSTDLYWNGKWTGDQLFVSISNRLGLDLDGSGRYNGNVFTVPDGPYYFIIFGDTLTLNGGESAFIPEGYRRFDGDTLWTDAVFEPDFARIAAVINKTDGVWTIEMAIYNPSVTLQSILGFNIGGSTGSAASDEEFGDAYAYWTWQPNVPDDPYAEPAILDVWRDQELWADPGTSNLATSQAHAVLLFVNDIYTSVEPDGLAPHSFSLYQNYPNPFNPSTTIRFNVEKQGTVYLKIFNILGQEVATLINGQVMSAGTYMSTFAAKNLSSGIYLYELRVDNMVKSKKMVLLK